MGLDTENVEMMANAIGRVVIELSSRNEPVTKETIIEMLEFYRRITRNDIGKGCTGMRRI